MTEQIKKLTPKEIDDVLEEALNSACFTIQKAIGQTDGGVAGVFFTGDNREKFDQLFRQYIGLEMNMAGDDEDNRLKDALIAAGFEDISTGGGFGALHLANDTHYILLSEAEGDTSNVTKTVQLYLGFYKKDTAEQVSRRDGLWSELEAIVNDFIYIAEVPEPLPSEG